MEKSPTPTWHIHPAHGWINDPNGLVRWRQRWHVFFQHNPIAPVHDRIHWGHVSSDDLLHWTEHPVAFGPRPGGPDSLGCWSGAFVTGLDVPAVVYSGVTDPTWHSTVCLRVADPGQDSLDTWSEPTVVAHTPVLDDIEVMRDPFLFERAGQRWALLGAGLRGGIPAVLLFSCNDIHRWAYAGLLLTGTDPIAAELPEADIWECPQLLFVDGVAVLLLSLQLRRVLGSVVAISGRVAQDDARPSFTAEQWTLLDAGDVFYAPHAAIDPDGGAPLLFGWVRPNDPQDTTQQSVAGCLSLPRRLTVQPAADGRPQVLAERDPVTDELAGAATRVHRPRVQLPTAARLSVVTAGTGSTALVGRSRRIEIPTEAGTQVWADGEVLEIFAPGQPSATYRDEGTAGWYAQVPADAIVEVSPLRSARG